MPELPEVETVARDLRPLLTGRTFLRAHILWPRTLSEPSPDELNARLAGRSVVDVGRRGKYLLILLDSTEALLIHLRMTGRLSVIPAGDPNGDGPHVRAWFELVGDDRLIFADPRKFGRIWLASDSTTITGKLGPEPLDLGFTPAELAGRLRRRKSAMKSLLLDQTVLAGLGNIYADEALFLAGIHPLRKGSTLTADEAERLHGAIRFVLEESLNDRGTMLRDYRTPYGADGAYQARLRVYRQTDNPCPRCGTPICRILVGQRSTHFCPSCQRELD